MILYKIKHHSRQERLSRHLNVLIGHDYGSKPTIWKMKPSKLCFMQTWVRMYQNIYLWMTERNELIRSWCRHNVPFTCMLHPLYQRWWRQNLFRLVGSAYLFVVQVVKVIVQEVVCKVQNLLHGQQIQYVDVVVEFSLALVVLDGDHVWSRKTNHRRHFIHVLLDYGNVVRQSYVILQRRAYLINLSQ